MAVFFTDMGAYGYKHGIKTAGFFFSDQVFHLVVEAKFYAHLFDALHLGGDDVARQPVGRNTEVHHPAGHGSGFEYFHRMTQAGEVVGGRQAAGACAYDEHPFAAGFGAELYFPTFFNGFIPQKTLYGVDAD
jgi:hypothetical protein